MSLKTDQFIAALNEKIAQLYQPNINQSWETATLALLQSYFPPEHQICQDFKKKIRLGTVSSRGFIEDYHIQEAHNYLLMVINHTMQIPKEEPPKKSFVHWLLQVHKTEPYVKLLVALISLFLIFKSCR